MFKSEDFASKISSTLGVELTVYATINTDRKVFSLLTSTDLWLFPSDPETPHQTIEELITDLDKLSSISPPPGVTLIHYVVDTIPIPNTDKYSLGLGHEVTTKIKAIHELIDLPDTFFDTQQKFIQEELSPLSNFNNEYVHVKITNNPVNIFADSEDPDALDELLNIIQNEISGLIFIESEAGKGKTILFSMLAKQITECLNDRLSIFIPLRRLSFQVGASLDNILGIVGIVGTCAERVIKSIQSGLIVLILDGIDEISGRYDRLLISDLLVLISNNFSKTDSMILLSGRKAEARQLDQRLWNISGLALPHTNSDDFKKYVKTVVHKLSKEWNDIIDDIPDSYSDILKKELIDDQALREISYISDWIISTFPVVGKDASLFFIQGMAAIGIYNRIGNKKMLLADNDLPSYIPLIIDVCLAAVLFACLRERNKIEIYAKDNYTAAKQLLMLHAFSILSSTHCIDNLPTPNEIARNIFEIDPINQHEKYGSIIRQNAKHALLYAADTAAGAYRPKFLNEWIKDALLANTIDIPNENYGIDANLILNYVAVANHARYAYSYLIPELNATNSSNVKKILQTLLDEISNGSEIASGNLWYLYAALGDTIIDFEIPCPLPLAEIEQAEFFSCNINDRLNGDNYILDDCIFTNISIYNTTLNNVSLKSVTFQYCTLNNVLLNSCDGPIFFNNCKFINCLFDNLKSQKSPALHFINCHFSGEHALINQNDLPCDHDNSYQLVQFRESTTEIPINTLFTGSMTQYFSNSAGILFINKVVSEPHVECLRETLSTFFPTWGVGARNIQARDYIRRSALGRGTLPDGSPSKDTIERYLLSVGFSHGGRPDHLYAPWASTIGGSEQGRIIRNELIDFMLNPATRGETIHKLLKKIKQHFPSED